MWISHNHQALPVGEEQDGESIAIRVATHLRCCSVGRLWVHPCGQLGGQSCIPVAPNLCCGTWEGDELGKVKAEMEKGAETQPHAHVPKHQTTRVNTYCRTLYWKPCGGGGVAKVKFPQFQIESTRHILPTFVKKKGYRA